MASEGWDWHGSMTSARLSIFYDVRYEDIDDLKIECPSGVTNAGSSHLLELLEDRALLDSARSAIGHLGGGRSLDDWALDFSRATHAAFSRA